MTPEEARGMTSLLWTRLAEMGKRLHELLKTLPDNDAITDTLDYVVGALYGLARAGNLGFVDRPGTFAPTYRPFLTKYVLDIVADREVNELWLAGFYFNSAIQRLAASYDRIPKLLGATGDSARDRMTSVNPAESQDWYSVYSEVNSLKHDPEGKAKGRQVTMEVAVNAIDQLLNLIERKASELLAKYT